MVLNSRFVAVFLILGHPFLFGISFCIGGIFLDERIGLLTSLTGEIVASAVFGAFLAFSLDRLYSMSRTALEQNGRYVVLAAILVCIVLSMVNLANADTSGLFAKGSRLEFYFANDWFRRFVTFSYLPLAIGTFYALHALMSPLVSGGRFIFRVFIVALLATSLLAGSKGSAVLMIAAAIPFVFTLGRLPMVKIFVFLAAATVLYLVILLNLSSDVALSLASIVMRFNLSIDMSLLIVGHQGIAEMIGDGLNDVWIETFRNLAALGVRISERPIGVAVYQYTLGTVPTVGANCRFASLLLIYPARLDFLFLYPLVVTIFALLLAKALRVLGLPRAALVSMPCFVFQSFQDVYWFSGHVLPILFVAGLLMLGRAVSRASLYRISDPA